LFWEFGCRSGNRGQGFWGHGVGVDGGRWEFQNGRDGGDLPIWGGVMFWG
jgi:hypothetical protein